ncbi:MAG: ATP-binding cassette domain-containing protein, partial [Actinomycetota bacterium]|nr:ATP-binding cassette domain-containing protein [Actinomycetota bacterium]
LRLVAFTASAFIGGLAGGLAVQLDRVADPTAYGPLLSFELLVAVLVGGAASGLGPTAGVIVLGFVALAARGLGSLANVRGERFEPMLDALLVLAVLSAGSLAVAPGIGSWLRKLWPPRLRTARRGGLPAALAQPKRVLRASGLRKRFDEVVAADGVDLEVRPGAVAALIGPNGSGKTTVLRLLSGAITPEAGAVTLGDQDITAGGPTEPVRAGLVRTLQPTAVFPELTARENVLVGTNRTRLEGGVLRSLTSTPRFRRENELAEARAAQALAAVGLESAADRRAGTLASVDQRLLMIASALATEPAVLLVDEPAAGAGDDDLPRVAGVLTTLAEQGVAVLVVDHNLRLVRAIAEHVFVLAEGRIVAAGSVDTVAEDPFVREAYLGRQRL